METFISLLRGVNVGGSKSIRMIDLKNLYESLELKNVTTFLQSGNVIFQSDQGNSAIVQLLEESIRKTFSFEVSIILRTRMEIENVVLSNPFKLPAQSNNPYVTFLSEIPNQDLLDKIKNIDFTPDKFVILNKEIFIFCPAGYSKTKLSNTFFESKLKVKATTRNWNTVMELNRIAYSVSQK